VFGANLSDTVTTGDGDDSLNGGGGADVLAGGAGADYLDGGGGGIDQLAGGAGDDALVVDGDDVVIEAAGEGFDNVAAKVSYALTGGAEVEILSTTDNDGTAAINLLGNGFGQVLVGNAGNNYLDGGGGADVLAGRDGDDAIIVDADDVVIETIGGGYDNVAAKVSYVLGDAAEVEVLSTTDNGGSASIDLTGNAFGQVLVGNAGSNVLDGKGGNDVLVGLGGADTFAFTTLGAGNVDTVLDFSAADDVIALDDAVFAGLTAGALDPNAFVTGTSAQDADDRIIYDQTTGALYYDADGNGAGAAIQFATLQGAPAITASDFTVI
jgi:Ca2+-binding RTX toxin-like protein